MISCSEFWESSNGQVFVILYSYPICEEKLWSVVGGRGKDSWKEANDEGRHMQMGEMSISLDI